MKKLIGVFVFLCVFCAGNKAFAAQDLIVSGQAEVGNTGAFFDFTNYNSNVVVNSGTGEFYGYVWSEDIGWIDMGDLDHGGPVVVDLNTGVVSGEGYATETGGTVDFNRDPYNSNVTIDFTTGEFEGYVWSEDLGWVDMLGVSTVAWPTMAEFGVVRVDGEDYDEALSEYETDDTTPVICGTGTEGEIVTVEIDGEVVATVTIDDSGEWCWTAEEEMDSGTYEVRITLTGSEEEILFDLVITEPVIDLAETGQNVLTVVGVLAVVGMVAYGVRAVVLKKKAKIEEK